MIAPATTRECFTESEIKENIESSQSESKEDIQPPLQVETNHSQSSDGQIVMLDQNNSCPVGCLVMIPVTVMSIAVGAWLLFL